MEFDTKRFLTEHAGTPHGVLALFSAYGIDPPGFDAVEKWFQRRSIPSAWFPIVLCLVELENGKPTRLAGYLHSGKSTV